MQGIMVRPEHGREARAGAIVHRAQKGLLAGRAPPAAADGDGASVREYERARIERIGVSMLGQPSSVLMIHWPARIGRRHLNLRQRCAEMTPRGGLGNLGDPALDLDDHGAAQDGGGSHHDAAAGGRGHEKRTLRAAYAWAAQGGTRDEEGALAHRSRTEASPFIVSAPRLVTGDERWTATGREHQGGNRTQCKKTGCGEAWDRDLGALVA